MSHDPRKLPQWFSPRKYWQVSLAVLILFCIGSMLLWSPSSALAASHASQRTAHYLDDNPPFPVGPQGSERWGGKNESEINTCTACAMFGNAANGDPVDAYSGNFSDTFTDLSVPGRGVPLLFTRSYNAQSANQSTSRGPLGYGWTDSYAMHLGNGNIYQENGSTVNYSFNGTSYVPASRVLATFVNTGSGYTFTRLQTQLRYNFNYGFFLVSESDRNGYVTTLTYNSNNQLTAVTDPAGRSLTFAYNSGGQISSISDPNQRKVSYAYDTNGNLISVTDVKGGVTKFTYDANHLLLTMTDPKGDVLTNTYDGSGRVISQKDAMGRTTTFSYGVNTTTITDPKGNVIVENFHNALLVSETTGFGTTQAATWKFAYNPYCNGLQAITDPNGHSTYQTWDVRGNKLSMTDALGRITKYIYDSMNDLTSITDPKGVTTTLTYDASGNLLSISTPLTGTAQIRKTTFAYGDAAHPGDVTAITDPDSKTWTYTYDANGDRISSADPLHDSTTYQYNNIGWLTSQATPLKHTASYTYNNFGDVTLVQDALGHSTTLSYDANRNLAKLVDAAGNTTQYTYDLDNELTKITRADGSTLSYSYDGDGNQTSYTDGLGNKTSYAYSDPAFPNRITAVTDPLNRTTSYAHDLAGNVTSLVNPSAQSTTYTYDAANELTGVTYSDGKTPNVTFTYDADGQRSKMADGTGSTTYTYDSLNRLTQFTNGAGSTVAYTYDLKGQVLTLTYPGSQQVTRTYDAAGRLKTVKDWLSHTTSYGYDADSNLTSQTYPNTVKATFKYDRNDQVINIADALGTTSLLSFTYTRNALSLLASSTPSGVPQSNETYGYTALNQLSTVNQPTYQYDHGDNLTKMGTATLTYDAANELKTLTQASGTTTFTYNVQGDLIKEKSSSATINLTYDQANRLTAYGTSAQYSYNGDGLRMSKTVSGTPEAFTWDLAEGLPLLLQDGTTQYVYGPGGLPLEQVKGSTVLYYHQDQLGSTRALTNSVGTVVASYGYDAYGNVTGKTGSVTNPFQYAGQYTDAESGLQYLRARYYNPAIGQFLTRDPLVGLTQQADGYAMGDPLNETDASGLKTAGWCWNASEIGGGVDYCRMIDSRGEVADTETRLVGPEYGGSIGFGLQWSNDANSVNDLRGEFDFFSISIGIASFQKSWGNGCHGNPVNAYELTIGPGIKKIGLQWGKSNTIIHPVGYYHSSK